MSFAVGDYGLPNFLGKVGRMSSEPDYARLGRYLLSRRGPLSQEAIARMGGPSTTVQSQLETGSYSGRFRAETWRKIDDAYGLEPGSALRVAAGGEAAERPAWPPAPSQERSETAADMRREGEYIVALGTRAVSALTAVESALLTGASADELRRIYAERHPLLDVLNMWFSAMRITGVIDPLREAAHASPSFMERLHGAPAKETSDDQSAATTQAGESPAMHVVTAEALPPELRSSAIEHTEAEQTRPDRP